jgi:hypothetical protein
VLIEFQQAFADLVASPAFCREVRENPAILMDRYQLTEREHAQLVGVVGHRGMECTCMLYRANRLAPLALNLPQVCKALGGELKAILDDYWSAYPKTNVHFIAESYRFCEFLQQRLRDGRVASDAVEAALAAEMPSLVLRLDASYTEVGAAR